tara:strand:+ start:186 stop:536 length:351 start_codon:yes stop_codon:yes gene_type:complete
MSRETTQEWKDWCAKPENAYPVPITIDGLELREIPFHNETFKAKPRYRSYRRQDLLMYNQPRNDFDDAIKKWAWDHAMVGVSPCESKTPDGRVWVCTKGTPATETKFYCYLKRRLP